MVATMKGKLLVIDVQNLRVVFETDQYKEVKIYYLTSDFLVYSFCG
jgi:hypothetical protein